MSLRRFAQTDEQEETLGLLEKLATENGINLRFGTSIGRSPQSIVLDIKFQGGEVVISRNGALSICDGLGSTFPPSDKHYEEDESYVAEYILDHQPKILAALNRVKESKRNTKKL